MRCATARVAMCCFALLALAVGSAAAQQQQAAASPASAPFAGATISDWKGNIRLTLPGQPPSAPARSEVLPPGTVLETESGRLLLHLTDGSQILIGPHTRLLVQQPAPSERNHFQILFGRIRAFVSKQTGGAAPFQVGTPSAVIAVRGTEFDIEVNRLHVTQVDVFEGLVEVTGRGSTGRSVLVEPGFSTRVGIDGLPEEPQPTDTIRPEIERPQPGERDLKDAKELREVGEQQGLEGEVAQALENDAASEISDAGEPQGVSEPSDVQTDQPSDSGPN